MDKVDKRELMKSFIEAMLRLGYANWYVGRQIAFLIWVLDSPNGREVTKKEGTDG